MAATINTSHAVLPKDAAAGERVTMSSSTSFVVRGRHGCPSRLRFGSDDFQQFDGRLAVAMDVGQMAVGPARSIKSEPRHHGRPGKDAQEGGRFNPALDTMLNQH